MSYSTLGLGYGVLGPTAVSGTGITSLGAAVSPLYTALSLDFSSPSVRNTDVVTGINVSGYPYAPPVIHTDKASIFSGINVIPQLPVSYESLNDDMSIRNKLVNYYYDKLYDQWLHTDFRYVLKNIKVRNGKAIGLRRPAKQSLSQVNEKIDFIETRLLTRNYLYRLLATYVAKSHTNWYDLKRNKSHIKRLILHKLKRMIDRL